MDFQNYYQAELSYLRDVGKAFAEKHPALAGMLAERGGDPDVERLIEGFAFIAARFRQRIDDSVPELVEALTDLLLPHFLRPTPASSIVQFQSPSEGARGAYALPSGVSLLSVPVHGTRCEFRSTRPLALLPLKQSSMRLDDASSSTPTLTLRFELAEGAHGSVFRREGIRLHLHGELPITTQLYLWLVRHVASVSLRTADGARVELGARSIRPVGFDEQDTLFPWPSFAPQGPRFLLEYFTLQTKFLFVDVLDMDRAPKFDGRTFELAIQFTRPPALPARLSDDMIRLHCVPAVNLFDVAADPVRIGIDARPVLLRAQGIDPLHAEVFDVRSVLGMNAARPERRSYEAFQAFRHALRSAKQPGFYKLKRERSPVDDGLHTFVNLLLPASGARSAARVDVIAAREPSMLEPETLSIEMTCTNRSLPGELQIGDLRVPTADTPAGVSFSNIGLVSRPTRPPLGSDLAWHFVAHLSAFRRGMADLEALKAMLLLYNRQEDVDFPAASANRARVDAIRQVRMRPTTRVNRGAPVRGALFEVELDSRGFTSEGDAFLFGSILHHFLALGAPLNGFADLHVVLLPTRVDFRWSAELS
jgi:type VI secretion system protein ImpG